MDCSRVWLHKGGPESGCLEKTGDGCLAPWRWQCGVVAMDYDAEKQTISRKSAVYEEIRKEKSMCEPKCEASGDSCVFGVLGIICFSPLILAAEGVLGVIGGCGLGLKKIALGCDEKSRAYQAAIKAYELYEKARDNRERLKILDEIITLEDQINIKENMIKTACCKKAPKTIILNKNIIVQLKTKQISEIQQQYNSEYKKSIDKLNEEKELLNEKLIEKKSSQRLKVLDEEAEKYRLIWQRAQEEYFKMVENHEITHLLEN